MQIILPEKIQAVLTKLHHAKFEAYVVGGCVRDALLNLTPKDWDITTNALPEEILKIFPGAFYNNAFGTVGVLIDGETIEVTTYRGEANYTDHRHPEAVKFGVSLEEDLSRRDFTINALAYDGKKIIDLFKGQEDLKQGIIRAVGDPNIRFKEDALRMLRAIRFSCEHYLNIDSKTWEALLKNRASIKYISGERVRDEILKILNSDDPFKGFWLLHESGLLKIIMPELEAGYGIMQNKHHLYTILFHNLLSMQYCPSEDPLVKLATLLHDLGKPQTKQGRGPEATFHQHEYVSAKLARNILIRLKFSRKDTERVVHLIRQHMFYYNIGEITDAGVRRLIKRIGAEHLKDLLDLRIGDRMGSGCLKEKPFKLVELERRIIKVSQDPITTSMLAIDGNDLIKLLELKPGREIGIILNKLLEEVLEDPSLNTREYLEKRAREIYN